MLKESPNRFLLMALGLFLVVGMVEYVPLIAGRVPLPAHLVTNFPAWHSTMPRPPVAARSVDYGDLVTFFYPWRVLSSRLFHQHELPQWNRHILGGTPLIASAPGGIFYPIHALFYVLPIPAAWSLKLFFNVVLAGFLTAMFVKSLGPNRFGAMSAGVIYALCGFITGWQGQSITDAALWLPLICWSVYQIYKNPSALSAAVGAFAFAMPVLAGHPETAAHVTLVGVCFFAWQILIGGWNRQTLLRRLGWFTAVGLLALGLSAIQMYPTVEWLGEINRPINIDWEPLKLKSHELLAFFSRDLSGTPNSSNIYIPEKTAYVGIATLLLAPFALLRTSGRRHTIFFVILIVLSLQVAARWEPGNWFASHTPILNGIKNWRLLGIADFAFAILAGFGISHLCERRSRASAAVWIMIGTVTAAASYGIWELHRHLIFDVSWLRGATAAAVLLAVSVGIISLRLLGRIHAHTFGAITLALLCLDLMSFAFGYVTFVRPEEIFPPAPAITFLQQHDPQNNRVVNLNAYSVNAEIVYGLESAGGWEIALKRVKELLNDFSVPRLDEVEFDLTKILSRRDRRLDLMNARYFVTNLYNKNYNLAAADPQRFEQVFTNDRVAVFENRRALPRAWFIPLAEGTIEVLPRLVDQFKRLRDPSFDPERSVILSSWPAELPRDFDNGQAANRVQVTPGDSSSNSITLKVDSPQPGIVILSQIFYPGWRASVDSVGTTLLRPDYTFMGVPVPAGKHDVRLEFRPLSVRFGAAVTSISVLLVLGLCVASARARSSSVVRIDEQQRVFEVICKAAARRPGVAIVAVAGLLSLFVFLGSPRKHSRLDFDPSHPPQVVLSATEVRAGIDSYTLTIDELPNATVSIQYSIDNEKPGVFLVTLDSDGSTLFEVVKDTRKGTYRILAFREANDQRWIPANESIVVK